MSRGYIHGHDVNCLPECFRHYFIIWVQVCVGIGEVHNLDVRVTARVLCAGAGADYGDI